MIYRDPTPHSQQPGRRAHRRGAPAGFRAPGLAILLLASASGLIVPGTAGALDNPMRPPRFAAGEAPTPARSAPRVDWVLQSTLVSEQRRSAVINGRAVTVGEEVLGARVLEIQRGRVALRFQGRTLRLSTPDYLAKNSRDNRHE